MNKKNTNRLVVILNIIFIIISYCFVSVLGYLNSGTLIQGIEFKSIYGSTIIELLMNNANFIFLLSLSIIGILNIVCAIQNKRNKKIFFWQLVFGICNVWRVLRLFIDYGLEEVIKLIAFSIVPIILAIINLIRIKRNKPKVIQVISYIAVIIFSILSLLKIIDTYLETINLWEIISLAMLSIYIHYQDKDIEETKSRKITNIILYYVIQLILVVGFVVTILFALLISKVNESIWENGLSKLYNDITTLQGVTNGENYIIVENDSKYGFINEKGEEKIPCQYDMVSYFFGVEINNNIYCFALAEKDNKFYIISTSNDKIELDENLAKYFRVIHAGMMTNMGSGNTEMSMFSFSFQVFLKNQRIIKEVFTSIRPLDNEIALTKKGSNYIYKNNNYSMLIEDADGEKGEKEVYYDNYNKDEYYEYYDEYYEYFFLAPKEKYRVTILKANGEEESSIVYLPEFNEYYLTLKIFSDGYIEFENEDKTLRGWYDNYGNKFLISSNYSIKDIKNGKIILTNSLDAEQENFIIIDSDGNVLLQASELEIYDDFYIMKNHDNEMMLLDTNLNVISNKYDLIYN